MYTAATELWTWVDPGLIQGLCTIFVHGLPCRRKVYDQTGDLSDAEELSGQNFEDLYSYYRDLYRKVTEADIEQFAADFRGSNEEAAEVLQYYERFQGDMKQVQGTQPSHPASQ